MHLNILQHTARHCDVGMFHKSHGIKSHCFTLHRTILRHITFVDIVPNHFQNEPTHTCYSCDVTRVASGCYIKLI